MYILTLSSLDPALNQTHASAINLKNEKRPRCQLRHNGLIKKKYSIFTEKWNEGVKLPIVIFTELCLYITTYALAPLWTKTIKYSKAPITVRLKTGNILLRDF